MASPIGAVTKEISVTSVSTGEKVQGIDLTQSEKDLFDLAWSRMTYVLGYNGPWVIFDQNDYLQTYEYLTIMKARFGGNNTVFEGLDPVQGWGVRLPLCQDLLNGTTLVWDVTWGTTGDRGWITDAAPDADALSSEGYTLMKYTTDDTQWGFGMIGVTDWAVSPKIKGVVLNRRRNEESILPTEFAFRTGQVPLAKWDHLQTFLPGVPIKAGCRLRTGQLGVSNPYPLGLTALDAQRSRNPNPPEASTIAS